MLSRRAAGYFRGQLRSQTALDRVATQRQRQPGNFQPPLAQVHNALQTGFGIGQLPFMDDEAGLVITSHDLGNDLVEGHDFGFNPGREKPQREICRGQSSRDSNFFALDFALRKSLSGHDHGAVAIADAAAAGQQSVIILDVGIGVERDGRDVINAVAFPRLLVQGLDVAKRMSEAQSGNAHLVGGQSIEHEGVVGVGAVRDADLASGRSAARRILGFRYESCVQKAFRQNSCLLLADTLPSG